MSLFSNELNIASASQNNKPHCLILKQWETGFCLGLMLLVILLVSGLSALFINLNRDATAPTIESGKSDCSMLSQAIDESKYPIANEYPNLLTKRGELCLNR